MRDMEERGETKEKSCGKYKKDEEEIEERQLLGDEPGGG